MAIYCNMEYINKNIYGGKPARAAKKAGQIFQNWLPGSNQPARRPGSAFCKIWPAGLAGRAGLYTWFPYAMLLVSSLYCVPVL